MAAVSARSLRGDGTLRPMKTRLTRLLVPVALGFVLSATLASPALAAQARRTWHTSITGSANGSVVLSLVPNNSGSIAVTMHGLTPGAVYAQILYKGTCAHPRTLVKLPGLRVTDTGDGARTMSLTPGNGAAVWSVGTNGTVAFRISKGSWYRCGTLSFEVATRISISRFGIDLPVVHEPAGRYPWCNVAMYLDALSQPGEAGPTMIYAHARTGMFLPLLTASKSRNGAGMVGMIVNVWTSDSRLYTYQVTAVHRFSYALPSSDYVQEVLWLQTSEGPHGTPHKLILEAKRISVTSASYAASHPTPHIVYCS
jgi:hypothetical protein